MNPNVLPLIESYRLKGVLIDTNLLLLLLAGNISPARVGTVGRTSNYRGDDCERLRDLMPLFARWLTAPQVLTETGNLLKRNCGNLLFELQQQLAAFISASGEVRILSKRVPSHPTFFDLGYADSSILYAAAGRCLLLTDDGPMEGRARSLGVDVLPFAWLSA